MSWSDDFKARMLEKAKSAVAETARRQVRALIGEAIIRSKRVKRPVEMDIGPNLAFEAILLEINPASNREINKPSFDDGCQWRKDGNDFYTRAHPVVINWLGGLETGQHRGHIGIFMGMPSRHHVVIGVEPGSEYNKDRGHKIKPTDEWHRSGYGDKTIRHAVINIILCLENQNTTCSKPHALSTRGAELNGQPKFEAAIAYAKGARGLINPAAAGLAYHAIMTTPRSDATSDVEAARFFAEVANGTNVRGNKRAIEDIRERLAKLRRLSHEGERQFRGISGNFLVASALILAWNSYPKAAPSLSHDGLGLLPKVRK